MADKKTAVEILEEMTKMFKETNFEEWAQIQSADEYVQQHPGADNMQAFSERFGLSQENLHSIIEFLQCEPGTPESKEKLKELIDTITDHVPKGVISHAEFNEWKAMTQEATNAMQELSESWEELNQRKAEFEATKADLIAEEQKALKEKETAEQSLAKAQHNMEQTKKRIETMENKLTNPDQQLDEEQRKRIEKALLTAKTTLANQEAKLQIAQEVLDQSSTAYQNAIDVRESNDALLSQAEQDLKKKTFIDNATSLVCSLPERMEDAVKRAPILDATTLDIKELTKDVHELADKYQNRDMEYGRNKAGLMKQAEDWQLSDNRIVSWIGTKIIDKEIDRIQDHYTKTLQSEIDDLQKKFDKETSRVGGIGGFFNNIAKKFEDWAIEGARNNAMDALEKINNIERKMKFEKDRADDQALKQLKKNNPELQNKTDAEIKNSDEFKKLSGEIAKARLQGLEDKRQTAMDAFKKNYKQVHDLSQEREARYVALAKKAAELDVTVKDLRKTHDINSGFQFHQARGFAEDLKQLMDKHNQQVQSFANIKSQTAQQLMDEVERDR